MGDKDRASAMVAPTPRHPFVLRLIMAQHRMNHLHVVGLGGSNKVMAGELSRLVRRALTAEQSRRFGEHEPEKVGPGGLLYPFDPEVARVLSYYHRTAARALWVLYASDETRLEPLYQDLFDQVVADDRGWLRPGLRVSVLSFNTNSVEAGERQIVGVVKNAIVDGAQRRGIEITVAPEDPDIVVHARSIVRKDQALLSVSIDLAGRPLHQRGYRLHAGPAPLREDLAAQLLMLARFDARHEVLIDPMAGSGTLVIEGALMGAGKPIWTSGRSPQARGQLPFSQEWPSKLPALFPDTQAAVYAAEIDEETYGIMDRCLSTAGTSAQTYTYLGDFRDWDLKRLLVERGHSTRPVLLVCNPPYGGRLGMPRRELRTLYEDLMQFCRSLAPCRAAFLVGDPDSADEDQPSQRSTNSIAVFLDAFGRPRVKKPMKNGPMNALFLLYDF
jgi:23S rRNA G2445 N2-methylase RlmL